MLNERGRNEKKAYWQGKTSEADGETDIQHPLKVQSSVTFVKGGGFLIGEHFYSCFPFFLASCFPEYEILLFFLIVFECPGPSWTNLSPFRKEKEHAKITILS